MHSCDLCCENAYVAQDKTNFAFLLLYFSKFSYNLWPFLQVDVLLSKNETLYMYKLIINLLLLSITYTMGSHVNKDWGCWQAPVPVWMDSAGLPTVGQLATHVWEPTCL